MKFYIDNLEVNPREVGYRAIGFSFGKLECYKKLSLYKFTCSQKEFNEVFEEDYNRLVNELKEDDEISGIDFDPPYEGATNYPRLNELNNLSSKQLTEWLDYLKIKIFEFYFPWNYESSSSTKYSILTLDKIELIDDLFVFSGQVDHQYLWEKESFE